MSLSPSGTFSSTEYFFLKNQQGDIKFIVDANGNTLNEYVYDAWGNHKVYKYVNGTILTDSSENPIDISGHSDYTNDIGNINPFRYRGYYFDAETGWYYLNSRYYDPQTRRFLNADDPSVPLNDQATLFGGLNLYSYCLNNPVMLTDNNGHSSFWDSIWGTLTKIAIGVGVVLIGAAVTALTAGVGAGFMAAFGAALLTSVKAVAISTAISSGIGFAMGGITTGTWEGAFKGFIKGFADGVMWGGIFAGGAQILSGGFKLLAKVGVSTGRKGGIQLTKNIKILSPNNVKFYENGGTLLKIGKNFRLDVGSQTLLHMHLFKLNHIPLGTILSSFIGGLDFTW